MLTRKLWLCCAERVPPALLGYESLHNTSSLPRDPGWSPISTWQKSQWAMPSTTTWVPQPPDQYFHPRNPLFLTINMIYFSWLCLVWFKIQYFFLEEQFDPLYITVYTLTSERPRAKTVLLISHSQIPNGRLISKSSQKGITLFNSKIHT